MVTKTAEKVIAIAEAEVGYLEKASLHNLDDKTANAGSGNFTKYARDLDVIPHFYNFVKQGFAWCDIFVDWCFVQAFGVAAAKKLLCQPDDSYGAGCLFSSRYYKWNNQFHTKNPKPGDQIFFWNGARDDIAHTGIVYKVDDTYVYTIEGNTSGASGVVANGGGVCKKKYKLSYDRIYGYGRPAYDEEAEKPKTETTVTIELSMLRNGDKGEQVKTLQRLLIALGYNLGSWGADGNFGAKTEEAVRAFQKARGIGVDGIVGKDTWTELLKG